MFAQSILNNYSLQIESVSLQITELEAQLTALREQQKQLEAERQAMSTLASAGESAIAQAQQFLTLANRANRAELIEAFWTEMDQIRNSGQAIADLPTSEPTEEHTISEVIREEFAKEVTDPIFDVEASPVTDSAESDTPETNGNGNGNGHHPTETDLKTLLEATPYADLRKLAKGRNLDGKGKKEDLIQRLLDSGLTHEEITN